MSRVAPVVLLLLLGTCLGAVIATAIATQAIRDDLRAIPMCRTGTPVYL